MPPDGVLWYARDREVRCARFTRRNAFFDRRGLPPSLESFLAHFSFSLSGFGRRA
jgi:hypothetical protein